MASRSPRVLIVEDEALIRIVTAEFLEDMGFQVVEAASGDDAISILKKMPVDAVFTDVRMPGNTDGFALAAWIRGRFPFLPVLITSGDVGPSHFDKDLRNIHFLPKPYDLSVVASRMRHATQSVAVIS